MNKFRTVLLSCSVLSLMACHKFHSADPLAVATGNSHAPDSGTGSASGSGGAGGSATGLEGDKTLAFWETCRDGNGGSVRYVLAVVDGAAGLVAHVFAKPGCSGEEYETYELGKYELENQGRRLHRLATFPRAKAADLFAVGTSPVLSATLSAVTTKETLKLDLANIRVLTAPDKAESANQTLSLSFKRLTEEPMHVIAKIPLAGLTDKPQKIFKDVVDAGSYLNSELGNLIDEGCMSRFLFEKATDFKARMSQLAPRFNPETKSVFEQVQSHAELTKAGFAIAGVNIAPAEDTALTPYALFLLTYVAQDPDAKVKSAQTLVVCPVRPDVRAPGQAVSTDLR